MQLLLWLVAAPVLLEKIVHATSAQSSTVPQRDDADASDNSSTAPLRNDADASAHSSTVPLRDDADASAHGSTVPLRADASAHSSTAPLDWWKLMPIWAAQTAVPPVSAPLAAAVLHSNEPLIIVTISISKQKKVVCSYCVFGVIYLNMYM